MSVTVFPEETHKPIFYFSPRSLEELASFKIALNMWLEKFEACYSDIKFLENIIHEIKIDPADLSNYPAKIAELIRRWFIPIVSMFSDWMKYKEHILDNLSQHYVCTRFNQVVFGADGRIDYKRTVAKFVDDESLGNLTRFRIACSHCFEEKIDHFWPAVRDALHVRAMRFDKDFMTYYWVCRKNDYWKPIPFQEFSRIESFIIANHFHGCNFIALEYFLTLIDREEQFTMLDRLFRRDLDGRCARYLLQLLPKLHAPLQHYLLDRNHTNILYSFVKNCEPLENVAQCWLHISQTVTPDGYFDHIILHVIRYKNQFIRHGTRDFYLYQYQNYEVALEQIWLSTPANIKEYALQDARLTNILNQYILAFDGLHYRKGDIRFLIAILSDADAESRNKLWVNNWSKLMVGASPPQFNHLMELCLSVSEDVENFKETLPKTEVFQNYHDKLLVAGNYITLDEILNHLYPDPNQTLNTKKTLLANGHRIILRRSGEIGWENFSQYIDTLFEDELQAANFKQNSVFTDEVLTLIMLDKIPKGEFRELYSISSLFLFSHKRDEFKKKCLNFFYDMIIRGVLCSFQFRLWESFLKWCFDDADDQINIFVKSLPTDVIFERFYTKSIQPIDAVPLWRDPVVVLGEFLMWRFRSKIESEIFIRGRVKYYEKMNAAEVRKIFGRDKTRAIESMKRKLSKLFKDEERKRCVIS